MSSQRKRTYNEALGFVQSGFVACWRNASDLVSASKVLLDAGIHAPAVSLAVLALEEMGKLFAVERIRY
jgi:AbiV family abortive infection protein